MNCDPYRSNSCLDFSNNLELKRNDETMQDPNTIRETKKLNIDQDLIEENKSSDSINKDNYIENNLLKQMTHHNIEYEVDSSLKQEAKPKKGIVNLSLPYSPGLLLKEKKFSGTVNNDKSPFNKENKLLELTKFDLKGINLDYQSQNNEGVTVVEIHNNSLLVANTLKQTPLKLEEEQLGG